MTLSLLLWMVAGLAAVAVALWAFSAWLQTRLEAQAAALRQEVQTLTQGQVAGVATQVGQLTQVVTQQLGQVRTELQKGLSDSGMLASSAQQAVSSELGKSRDMLAQINQRLGEFQQAGRDLSQATQTLQSVLGGAKTRGNLGEVALERMLADALPGSAFDLQYRFASTGGMVDAVVRVGEKLVCVDSKFPLEAYRRLLENQEGARKEFHQAVRKHAEAIADKYILPAEGTIDYALMFVPSESIYYELLLSEDERHGRLDEYCRGLHVVPVSPNTLYAYLAVIAAALQGFKLEENVKQLRDQLRGLDGQLETIADSFEKLGTHLRNAQKTYNDADDKLARARGAVTQMTEGALPEPAAPGEQRNLALEPAGKE